MQSEDVTFVISLLSDTNSPLKEIEAKFKKHFIIKRRFFVLSYISMLLYDNLLDHKQQIIALWLILREAPDVDIEKHPFLSIFLYLYGYKMTNPNTCSPQLYIILNHILNKISIDMIGKLSIRLIFSEKFPFKDSTEVIKHKYAYNNCSHEPRNSYLLPTEICKDEQIIDQKQLLLELLKNNSYLDEFEAPLIRPVPEITPIFDDEIEQVFISSFDSPSFLYDECLSVNSKETIITLINRATEQKLKQSELDSIVTKLKKMPDIINDLHLSNEQIMDMVELNSPIAKEIIFYFVIKKNSDILDYISKIPINDTIESVLRGILLSHELPEKELENYIKNTIFTINNLKDQQNIYSRSVSLFCGLLCDVYKNGIKFGDDILIDTYSFCILQKNVQIKEAEELAKMLSN